MVLGLINLAGLSGQPSTTPGRFQETLSHCFSSTAGDCPGGGPSYHGRAGGKLHVETQGLSHCPGVLLAVPMQQRKSGLVPSQWEESQGVPGEEQHTLGKNTDF